MLRIGKKGAKTGIWYVACIMSFTLKSKDLLESCQIPVFLDQIQSSAT